ncbi:hypothetical protein C1N62_14910 [Nissabacter sp. SGAir0207]|nr:hypothetical protein C1N62_14910 [Nissabacter sp. SGAir0207]
MRLTSRTKTFLRWSGIFIVSLCYFLGLFIASQSFAVFLESQSLLLSNPISMNTYNQAMDSLIQATDRVFDAAIYGFAICVPFILFIFKKIR